MSDFFVHNGQYYKKLGTDKVYTIPVEMFHGYWKDPEHFTNFGDEDNNNPDTYIACPEKDKDLTDIVKKYCSETDKILEIGCNVGRNLDCLYRAGFTNLSGLDINKEALKLGIKTFPDTVGKIDLIHSSIEDLMWRPTGDTYDMIFTMGVLMHLHPTSMWVTTLFYQRTNKFLITAEDEWEYSNKAIPRNYKTIFEQSGFTQVEEKYTEYENNIDNSGDIKILYRIFKKNET